MLSLRWRGVHWSCRSFRGISGAGGGSKLEKGEPKQRKERGHPQVRRLNHILLAIDIFWGCCDYVIMYPCFVLHRKFVLE